MKKCKTIGCTKFISNDMIYCSYECAIYDGSFSVNKGWNMNTIKINGNNNVVSGKRVSIINDKIYVDGKLIEENLSGIVKVEFTGDLANISCTELVVNGNISGKISSTNTTINGSVDGDIDCTNFKAETVTGDVDCTNAHITNHYGNLDV